MLFYGSFCMLSITVISSREVIIIMGSLTTCDPGDINKTLEEAVNMKIKCSVINLSAEVRWFKKEIKKTFEKIKERRGGGLC